MKCCRRATSGTLQTVVPDIFGLSDFRSLFPPRLRREGKQGDLLGLELVLWWDLSVCCSPCSANPSYIFTADSQWKVPGRCTSAACVCVLVNNCRYVRTFSACVKPMISCFHSILIVLMCAVQGPGCHYWLAFCEAFNVIVKWGGKICREVHQRGIEGMSVKRKEAETKKGGISWKDGGTNTDEVGGGKGGKRRWREGKLVGGERERDRGRWEERVQQVRLHSHQTWIRINPFSGV